MSSPSFSSSLSLLCCSYVVNDGMASPLSNISQPGMSQFTSVLLSFYMSMLNNVQVVE